MNVPNQLTIGRLVITGVFVAAIAFRVPSTWSWAAILFIVASITDWFDGWLARRHGQETAFGALMDPLADKILTGSAFILLACEGKIPGWVVCLIMAREFLVTGLRLVAASQGAVLAADKGGKWKTGAQIALIIFWLLWLASHESPFAWFAPFFSVKVLSESVLGQVFLWLTALSTVGTGIRYLINNRHIFQKL